MQLTLIKLRISKGIMILFDGIFVLPDQGEQQEDSCADFACSESGRWKSTRVQLWRERMVKTLPELLVSCVRVQMFQQSISANLWNGHLSAALTVN